MRSGGTERPTAGEPLGPGDAPGTAPGRSTGSAPGRGRGRRAGGGDTRGAILQAARDVFGEQGFERATVRAIAARAGVDPALVHHYFGTKEGLFVTATEFPVDVATVVPALLDGPPDQLGERFLGYWLDLWESPAIRPLAAGLIRSATTDPIAAAMLRRLLAEGPLLAIARAIPWPDAPLRATLAGSQLIGLALARYIVGIEPLASAPREEVMRSMAPTIQRYLSGEVDRSGEVGPAEA